MKIHIFSIIASILILLAVLQSVMPPATAEILVTGFNSITGSNQTTNTLYLTMDGTSNGNFAKRFPTNVTFLINHYINQTISNKTLLSCVFNLLQTQNFYDLEGNLNYTLINSESVPYNYSATSIRRDYQMREKDTIKTELTCFWDSDVDDSIFQDLSQTIAGIFTETDTYYCELCVAGNNPAITDFIDVEKTTANYLVPFSRGRTIVNGAMTFLTFLYWIIKIFGLLLSVALVFAVAIWLYQFIAGLAK